ncbi:hypothetical protein FTX61_14555 [Nitriliruptoraceae bacterium ZYF776]|nr:hypothetical protein [Profundirhabdus halotolerans]
MEPVDVRASRIARSQRGLVVRRALVEEAGVAPATIRRRLRSGAWTQPFPGVVDLRTHAPSWRGEVAAVVLAAGGDAWASHETAAHLHRFLDHARPEPVDVLVPRGRHPKVGQVRLHTTRSLGADEVTTRHGIPLTTPARTLLDLAVGTAPPVLERYLADLARRDADLLQQVVELTDRHRTLPGRGRLFAVMARLPDDVASVESPLEVLGVQQLRVHRAPPYVLQHPVRDRAGAIIARPDVAWPDLRTALFLDGAAYHDLLAVRRDDAAKRDRLRAIGWRVQAVRRAELTAPSFGEFVASVRLAAASR